LGRFATTAMSLLVAATLLLVTVSGAISDSSQSAFDDLFKTYGQSILDIDVVGGFMSAGGTDGKQKEGPNSNVSQDIDGLYDKYKNDKRISHIVFSQTFNNIEITADGKKYNIENSGTVPFINELTAGAMPMGNDNEVVIPQSFVKKLGISDQEIIGKNITFNGTVYNNISNESISMPVNITVKVVGVVDTTIKENTGEQMSAFSVDDAFFFSQSALSEMRTQAQLKNSNSNFTIRTKTPEDLIAIKDELNANGIVPIGRFELVEDMVRLSNQTNQQSSSAIIVIVILSLVIVLVVSMMTALTRRREYAIYKVSGYSLNHLTILMTSEFLIATMVSAALFVCISPLTNIVTTAFWDVDILNKKLLITGILLVLAMGAMSCIVTLLISRTAKTANSLKTGER
ncbi:ABC transporter permease, partial [Clostridium botulinum]